MITRRRSRGTAVPAGHRDLPPDPRIVVVGAGMSGMVTLKALRERGLDAVAYEASDRVGGNWVFGNRNGMSSAYRTLHINTSRSRMQFRAFPMKDDLPDFPHHSHIAAYFDDYVDHFGIREDVRFRRLVEHAEPRPGGGWRLRVRDLDADGPGAVAEDECDLLVVANGHHWDARWPDPAYPGQDTFAGVQMHAHEFTDNEGFRDRRILVVGMGNSAMDIAVEASWVAAATMLSARRGVWVVPKYIAGKPLDVNPFSNSPVIPWQVRLPVVERALRKQIGRMSDYGLPEPAQPFGRAHITVSDTILSRIAHGEITVHPGIERFEGADVVFTDGTRRPVDVVVWATGYRITFPFLDPAVFSAPGNEMPLYRRVFPLDRDDLAFVGFVQSTGSIMPVAEAQGDWVADFAAGRYTLPDRDGMRAEVEAYRRDQAKRYVESPRHTIQVDPDVYLHRLAKERRVRTRDPASDLAARS